MSSNVKKGIFWGAIAVGIIFVVRLVMHLLYSVYSYAERPEPRFMGRGHGRGHGFEPHHFVEGAHHGAEFPWIGFLLFLLAAIAAVIFLFKWLRRKNHSFQTFVNMPLDGRNIRVILNQGSN